MAARYVSKFRPDIIRENKQRKDVMRTMGPAKVEPPSPDKYLKKHSKEPQLPEKTQCLKDASLTHSHTLRKPLVPLKTDIPPMGIHTKRDFTKTTVAMPMKPKPITVDTRNGHKQLLENSGLVPKFIMKKDYGKVPVYLQQRTEEAHRAQEEYNNMMKQQREQGPLKHLTEEEREAILKGLKEKWNELNYQYQSLSLVTDTISKKAHKERLEKAMKRLEDDIGTFEKSKTIYIPN
ncbi:enkurin [Pholidichthys leucotaenia]